MRIVIELHDYMTRVEQAVRENLPVISRIIGVMLKDTNLDGEKWERRFIVAVERHFKVKGTRPLNPDYATVMVCINSDGESMVTAGHYDMLNPGVAIYDMIERAGIDLDTPTNNETTVQLVISEEQFDGAEGRPFEDDDLVMLAKLADSQMHGMNGYEGWRARRNGRYVFDPDETRTGV